MIDPTSAVGELLTWIYGKFQAGQAEYVQARVKTLEERAPPSIPLPRLQRE